MLKREVIPSLLIIVMGIMDCVTTTIGVTSAGAKELNPAMAAIVNSNVSVFLVVKVAATMFIALAYILSRRMLMQLPNKDGKTFVYSMRGLTLAYFGLVGFLGVTVVNNLIVLLR